MELFTSFAISVAANIVTTLFARTSSEKEIRTAFQDAIEEWCPNEEIRRFREPTIYSFLKKYIDNPAINEDELTEEQCSFLEVFQKKLAEHQAATNYLSGIKERKYYDEVMSTLHVVNNKLDIIKKKLDAVDPRHEELHFMAVAEINTEIEETIVEPVNALLFGIVSAFGVDAYAYTEETEDGNIKVVLDENSQFEDEDANPQRKKYHDFDYDWDMEPRRSWEDINSDFDFWELFADAHIAGFQIMGIEFFDSVEKIEKCFNQMHVSQQLSVDERRMLANICMALRALGGTIEDHEDMLIIDTEAHFENVYVEEYGKFEKEGIPMGAYRVVYKDGDYEENLTEVTTIPVAMKKNLLDVVHVNREYYFKLTGYLGEVFNLVKEWRELSSKGHRDSRDLFGM